MASVFPPLVDIVYVGRCSGWSPVSLWMKFGLILNHIFAVCYLSYLLPLSFVNDCALVEDNALGLITLGLYVHLFKTS